MTNSEWGGNAELRGRPDVLGRDECLRLLPTVPIGRIVFNHQGYPKAYPVNFLVEQAGEKTSVWFCADRRSALGDLAQCEPVSFEVDSYDGWQHTGWSVLVTGRLRSVVDPGHPLLARLPWAPGVRDWVAHVVAETISGRRITPRR